MTNTRHANFISGRAAYVALALALGACQPDQVTTDTGHAIDTGHTDATSDTLAIDSQPGPDTGTRPDAAMQSDVPAATDVVSAMDVPMPVDAGRDAGCSTPTTLHPPSTDGGTRTIYCPFSSTDGGSNEYCQAGTEHCCEPTTGTASCVASATACAAGATDWQCADPVADCPSGNVCCGTGMLVLSPDPACGNFASGFRGTHCATSCTGMEIRMCTSDAECPSGQTCHPFRAKGNQVGGCM